MTTALPRTILVERSNGADLIVEDIPGDAKITFGPIQPGKGGYGSDNVLRIYQGSATGGNQLAVFTGVRAFRDLSLKIKQKTVVSKTKNKAEHGPNGSRRENLAETTATWTSLDEVDQEF